MGEKFYRVLMDDVVVAERMTLVIATIMVKALFEEYYNDTSMVVSVQEMDRTCGVKNGD